MRVIVIVAVLLTGGLLLQPAALGDTTASAEVDPIVATKPNRGVIAGFVPGDSGAVGERLGATLELEGAPGTAAFRLTAVAGVGAVTVIDFPAGALPAQSERAAATVAYTAGAGAGEIRADIEALDAAGEVVGVGSAMLYTLGAADTAYAGVAGPFALEVQLAADTGAPDHLEAVLGAGAATELAMESPAARALANITVQGTIRWTDSGGGTHAARSVTVQIRDDELVGSDLVATRTTNDAGFFSAVVDNDDGFLQGGRDIFIRVLAEATGARVVPNVGGNPHRIESSVQSDVADGATVTINLTANNTADNNTAFSVMDGLVTIIRYTTGVHGSGLPSIDVVFPTTRFTSLYDGSNLHVLRLDRFDWDVVHHEYGHYVMDRLNIEDNPGGGHTIGSNLGEARGKDAGNRLAWGEGWPTYFGTSGQQRQNAAALNVPNVGDLSYQDTEDLSVSYTLEQNSSPVDRGEDDELSVQRALWDLYDAADDTGDTGVALGDAAIWTVLDGADPENFSEAYAALAAGRTIRERVAIGCILTEHAIAPEPTQPASGATAGSTPPTFRWNAQGGGPSNLHDRFVVEFWDSAYSSQLFASSELTATSFTPTQAQWNSIRNGAGAQVNWFVRGRQTNSPVTGPYISCDRQLRVFGAMRPGFGNTVLNRNDDGSTGSVPIGFAIDFFGTNYSTLFVNNNGNVTFDSPLSTFTPFDLNATSRVIVAPFFADVDTQLAGEPVRYGTGTVGGRSAFGVTWADVDCFAASTTRTVRNYFQLVLVDRSDVSAGDFDIEFNYDQIQWEAGQASGSNPDCQGGSSARVGYSNGTGTSFELPGSGVNGAFLDNNVVNGLVHNSLGSAQLGRYLFEVRGGTPPGGGSISGTVSSNPPVSGARVQACESGGACRSSLTDGSGFYTIFGLSAGSYTMRAFPPGTNLNPATVGPVALAAGQHRTGVDIVLDVPTPPPAGTSIEPSTTGPSGVPSVFWSETLTLATQGCPGGTATYQIVTQSGAAFNGTMAEGPAGTYSAAVGPFFPETGPAEVTISIDCPGGDPDETIEFDIYIDPSGEVLATTGAPIAGATVTLFRSSTGLPGTFNQVPDGSAVMSPSNRTNPDTTDANGHFGWDVLAGFYLVEAAAPGCVNPADLSDTTVETAVLTIPPPVTDLEMVLLCDSTPPAVSITTPADGAAIPRGSTVIADYSCTDEPGGSGVASCVGDVADGATIDTATLGAETFTVTGTDAMGNSATVTHSYTVVDRTAPSVSITSPADGATFDQGDVVLADFACADEAGGSGLASCAGTVADGAAIETSTAGAHTFTVTGTDQAGNARTVTHRYTVSAVAPTVLEPDTVGLVDPTSGRWHLRNTQGQVTSFFYGNPGDIPFMGDWDCDGTDTPGLFRQSDAFAYLRNRNTPGIADIRFFFGNPSDVPLAGDWNGDGCDTLSIYRPDEQRFYIINELGEDEGGLGAADFAFTFGNPGDKPVSGDWDGDGIDEVGLHRESTGFFYWRDTLTTGVASGQMFFGDPDDRFVAGDWGTVDAVETPAVFRPSAVTFFLRHSLTQGVADSEIEFGEEPWLPVAGSFGLG